MNTATIRRATLDDVDGIVEMSELFYGTTSYAGFADFDPESVERLTLMLIQTGVMLVAEGEDGELVGMAGLVVVPFMFNSDHLTASEVVWWVRPDARAAGIGRALMEAIEPACRDAGCSAIQMVLLQSSPPIAESIYRRFGYEPTESCFTKEI